MTAFVEDFIRPAGQRLVLLCDWLPPDFGAVGQYTLLRGRELADAGHHVEVIGFSSAPARVETEARGAGSLRIRYIQRRPYDRGRLRERALWTLSANLALMRAAWSALAQADEIIFTGSPPYLLHFIVPLNLWRRRRLVYRITDFHPECLIAEWRVGGRTIPAWLRAIHTLTLYWRRRVGTIEVLGEDQAERLRQLGLAAVPLRTVRDPSPVKFTPGLEPLPRPAELAGRKILLYSGNFGVAHDHHTIVAALREVERSQPGRVGLWLNAVGGKADVVEAELRAAGVLVHRSQPVPLAALPALLRAADAHLITLRDDFVGYVLPSKVYACIASGRRVLYIGAQASDVHRLCAAGLPAADYRQVDCGQVAPAVTAIRELLLREEQDRAAASA